MKKFLIATTVLFSVTISGILNNALAARKIHHPKKTVVHNAQRNKININTADAKTLQQLPRIGQSKAQAIIAYRQKNGKFNSITDLSKIKGIGPKMTTALASKITV